MYDNAVEAGNKAISNTALIKMYGKHRTHRARLAKTVTPGATEIFVEPNLNLGWVSGDELGLAPTNINSMEKDYIKITAYDSVTGKIDIDPSSSIVFRHFGHATSTESKYKNKYTNDGIDIRGEIVLLTRNIQIVGEDVQNWGGQIVTSDNYFDIDKDGNPRIGRLYLDNVEIKNCS